MAARLRRSKRNIPLPTAPTKEEKFEKLISYATDNGRKQETLREFHMPTHVRPACSNNHCILRALIAGQILDFIVNNPHSKISNLEDLPLEVGMKIQDELTGNDLIMLALTSKTMAAKVEACTTRKIANITYYEPRPRDRSWKLTSASIDEDWRALGFLKCPDPRYPGWTPQPWQASGAQAADLQRRMQAHLGPKKCVYCCRCRKFRPRQKQFWIQLIEYENPGINKGNPKKQIAVILDQWAKAEETGMQCPAHLLLQEFRGKRSLRA